MVAARTPEGLDSAGSARWADDLARLVSTALVLSAIAVALRAQILGWTFDDLTSLIAFSRTVLLYSYDDLRTIFLMFVIVGVMVATIKHWRVGCRILTSLFMAFAIVSTLAGVINVRAVGVLGGPITYQWLYYADFFRSFTPQNAVLATLDGQFLVALSLALLVLLAGGRLIAFLLRRLCRLWGAPALMLCVLGLAYVPLTATVLSQEAVQRGMVVNPLVELVRTAIGDTTPVLQTLPTRADPSDFLAAPEAIPPSNAAPPSDKLRNVVLIVLESVGARFLYSQVGVSSATPHLDSVRSMSMSFEKFYAPAPLTNKSLFSLLTSNYPLVSFKFETSAYPRLPVASLGKELRSHGYRTAFFMSGDLRFQSADVFLQGRGFDTLQDITNISCDVPNYVGSTPDWQFLDSVDDSCTAEALAKWIGNGEQPFFGVFWTNMTHWPYFVAGEELEYGVKNRHLNRYLNGLRASDEAIGRILANLAKKDLLEATLIVVVGDHGEAFREHGQMIHGEMIYEEEIHIPLLLVNPVLFSGERSQVLGSIIDVAPTVMDLLHLSSPAGWQGRSLFATRRTERVYFFCPYRDVLVGYREGDMKYIFNATRNELEVYDLARDPKEAHNLEAQMPGVAQMVQHRLAAWVQYQQRRFAELSAAFSSRN